MIKSFSFVQLLGCFLLVMLFAGTAQAQQVLWPINRADGDVEAVFQRDGSQKATIRFVVQSAGNATVTSFKVRYRKYNLNGTFLDYVDPRPGVNSMDGDKYLNGLSLTGLNSSCQVSYQIDVNQGMYRMEVLINGASTTRDFGVGEVLVIAGQSNAAGYAYNGNPELSVPNSKFVKFNNTKSSLEGNDPGSSALPDKRHFKYYWGNLGSQLAANLNVPIAFYQTAWSNSGVLDWWRSVTNQSTSFTQVGYPYQNLREVLQGVRYRFGLRGILWHQGERGIINGENYADVLNSLIAQTRTDVGSSTFPWMVCRVSPKPTSGYPVADETITDSQHMTTSQNRVIGYANHNTSEGNVNSPVKAYGDNYQSVYFQSHVFTGPNTNDITDRVDGLHFNQTGQQTVANRFFTALTTTYNGQNFFGNSTPVLNNQTTDAPAPACGLAVCDCGFSLLSASQVSGQAKGQFTFHSCNATTIKWTLLEGTTEKASAQVNPTGPTIEFNIPASVNSNNYTLRVTPVNCTGDGSSVYEKPFSYTKPGTSWYVNVTPYPLSVPASGGTYYISVNSNTNWWMTGTPAAWSSFSNTSGSGIGTITVTVQPNTTTSSRSVTMMIEADNVAAQPYTVMQAAASSGSGTCYYFELANYHYTSGVTKQAMEVNGQGVVKIQDFNTSSSSQIWRVESVGAYKKISRASDANSVLGVSGGQSNVGDQVVLQSYSGMDYQLWEEEASSSVTTNCAGCVIYKHKANGNVVFGSPLGNWGDGDASSTVNDIRLVSKSDAYIYGNFKWFRTQVACPGGGRVSAEEITQPASRLSVSSNPNAGEFKVRFFLAPGQKGDLGVSDMTGRSVYQRAVTGEGEQTVDVKLSPSVSGTVIVSLKTEKGVLSERVLVTR